MTEAHRQGIAGTGVHNWILSDSSGSDLISQTFPRDSPLGLSFRGTGLIGASGGLPELSPQLQALTRELQLVKQSEADMMYLESIFPKYDGQSYNVNQESFLTSAGTFGPFMYDSAVALGLAACQTWQETQTVDGEAHFQAMLERSPFSGTTGLLRFDSVTGTRDPTSATFTYLNHVEDTDLSTNTNVQYKQVLSNIFQQGEWSALQDNVYNDGTTTIPADLPAVPFVEKNHLNSSLRAVGLVLCGVAVFMALACATWTCVKSETRVIKASQPLFLLTVCAGVIIFVSAIVPLSIDEGVATVDGCDAACISAPWLLCVGFSTIFAALFAKTRLINKIFNDPSLQRIRVTPIDMALPLLVLQGGNVIVLGAWTVVAPLEWTVDVEETDIFDRPTEVLGGCSSDKVLPFLIPIVLLNAGVMVYAIYQAYAARRVSTEYSEPEFIFKAMLSIMLVCFIGVPVLILAQDNPDAFFFVFSCILFVSSTGVLLLIFLPKMLHLNERKAKSSSSSISDSVHSTSSPDLSTRPETIAEATEHTEHDEKVGLAVLTTKSQEELIEENKYLRRRMIRLTAAASYKSGTANHVPAVLEKRNQVVTIPEESAIAAHNHKRVPPGQSADSKVGGTETIPAHARNPPRLSSSGGNTPVYQPSLESTADTHKVEFDSNEDEEAAMAASNDGTIFEEEGED